MNDAQGFQLIVPDAMYNDVVATHGAFCEQLSGIDRYKIADDVLSQAKAEQQATLLQRYTSLKGSRVLEVGVGLGVNLITWTRNYGANMVGIEPDAIGFEASFKLARELVAANGLDTELVINAVGEHLPFPDCAFDIVYSTNVLEHTNEPARVLREALRVLRPGGVLQFVFPNYRSYYDGHYGVLHPPVFTRGFLPWYIRTVFRRDPAFARTLRTELNVGWVKQQVSELQKETAFVVLGLGDDLFMERMTSLDFATWATLGRIKRLLDLIGNAHVRRLIGRIVISLRGWTPIVLTLRKQNILGES